MNLANLIVIKVGEKLHLGLWDGRYVLFLEFNAHLYVTPAGHVKISAPVAGRIRSVCFFLRKLSWDCYRTTSTDDVMIMM